jgi:MFS family permease
MNNNNLFEKRKSSPKVFFGWWIVLVTGILSGLGHGLYSYGMSALFKPLSEELGLNRAVTSVATGIGWLNHDISSPITGWACDRFGPRWFIAIGVFIIGVGLTLMNFVTSAWSYYIIWGVLIGSGINLALTVSVDKTLTNWFITKRGLAQGIKFGLIGLVSVIIVPVVSWLVVIVGWRMTCVVFSVVMYIGAPFAWYFVKQKRPEYYGMMPDGVGMGGDSVEDIEGLVERGMEYATMHEETEFTLRQAMKTPTYWMLIVGQACQTMGFGVIIHIIPFLTDMGIAPTVAGGMMGLMVFFTIPSRFFSGLIADRFEKKYLNFLLASSFFFQAAGFISFLFDQSLFTVYVFLILFGFGSGANTPVSILVRGRYFGRKAYGSIAGTSTLFPAPISLVSPVFAGWVYDTTGSYMMAFLLFAVLFILATVLILMVRPPKSPDQATDINKFM